MPAKKTATPTKTKTIWTKEEREAMREAVKDRKRPSKKDPTAERAQGEADIRAKIAGMTPSDRAMAERIHAMVTKVAPHLMPRTFYGMPGYSKDGKVLCFFKPAATYKERYATFGFQDNAAIDDGNVWPTSWELTKLTAADEAKLAALIKKAAS